ncbi:hypothetical protein N7509_014006 [Penicillium cosmopolitanum]|uniref:Zn(2)-C6 fungal-type domain-containing protein n=1 Tax=Penicillium cosmopolitanum TaxID=1131564 RepID=A0A9W9S2G2_9EURO|nr:uncharacterized protein N7509_014006 [Penicillium cosmopolitanum]KAJ5369394.1 hypothetical protein N7509_014006 [Penicillium cosmopolitanum]
MKPDTSVYCSTILLAFFKHQIPAYGNKMRSHQSLIGSSDSYSDRVYRKRSCAPCNRCRMKKCKLGQLQPTNTLSPCGRCEEDNTICAIGQMKRIHDKVYPKG